MGSQLLDKVWAGNFASAIQRLDLDSPKNCSPESRSRLFYNRAFCHEHLGLRRRAVKVSYFKHLLVHPLMSFVVRIEKFFGHQSSTYMILRQLFYAGFEGGCQSRPEEWERVSEIGKAASGVQESQGK